MFLTFCEIWASCSYKIVLQKKDSSATSTIRKSSKRKQKLYVKLLESRDSKKDKLFESIKKSANKKYFSSPLFKHKSNIKKPGMLLKKQYRKRDIINKNLMEKKFYYVRKLVLTANWLRKISTTFLQKLGQVLLTKSKRLLKRLKFTSKKLIVYKKTDEWYIKGQRVTTSGTRSDNEWQQVTTNNNEWYNELQRVTTSSTTSGNEWYNEWQRVTTNDWQ